MLLDEGLRELAQWLDGEEVQALLAAKILDVAGEEYPKLIGMLGFVGLSAEDLGNKFAGGLVRGANKWLHDIGDNPEHERCQAFDRTVEGFIERLKTDPAFLARIDQHKREWLERPALRESINEHMRDAFKSLAPDLRDGIAEHIAATVRNWDDATLVRDLELSVGRDLQFIRVNGTLVGGAVGLIIHAVSTFMF